MEYKRAFQNLNMPTERYLMQIVLPFTVVGLFVAAGTTIMPMPGLLRILVPLGIFGIAVGVAVMWPIIVADRKRVEIDNALPLFVTHFGVLSTSNLARTEIFRLLGEKKVEYKALANELTKIYTLVTNWNMSVPEAARYISTTTPSLVFADFLDRLAHAMETGQELESFLKDEQSVVMKGYSTIYETALYQIEQWKDIYSSLVMSAVFFVIFAIITPVISSFNSMTMLLFILPFFVLMELLLIFVLKLRVPADRLWHQLKIPTLERSRIRALFFGGLIVSALLAAILFPLVPLPLGINLAIVVSPLAATGIYASSIEAKIKRREDNYGAFTRSLGASIAARGGSMREVLRKVKQHNFGPLTNLVNKLYARLAWRLDDPMAWKWFAAESGSHLVDNFSEMFVEGVRTGGKPDVVGEIISDNVVRILNLRRSRYSMAGTFRGLLLGLTASMAFVLFIGVAVLGVLGDLFSGTAASTNDLNPVSVSFTVDTGLLTLLLTWILLFHCLMAAFMLKMVDGGSPYAGLATFVLMFWLSMGVALLNEQVIGFIFKGGG